MPIFIDFRPTSCRRQPQSAGGIQLFRHRQHAAEILTHSYNFSGDRTICKHLASWPGIVREHLKIARSQASGKQAAARLLTRPTTVRHWLPPSSAGQAASVRPTDLRPIHKYLLWHGGGRQEIGQQSADRDTLNEFTRAIQICKHRPAAS